MSEQRIKELETENQELRKTVQAYVEELERCAVGVKELLGHLEKRQQEGDRLRVRLAKATDVMEAGAKAYDKLLQAVTLLLIDRVPGSHAEVDEVLNSFKGLQAEYHKARENLSSSDGTVINAPANQSNRPRDSVPKGSE